MPLKSYHHRCVQDLAWVIASPPIISGYHNHTNWLDQQWCENESAELETFLDRLDQSPQLLLDAIETLKSRRLGEYFECLVGFWLTHSPNIELRHRNTQIRNESLHTLGEADFIFRYLPTDNIIHLEVAIKFYMGTGDIQDMGNWYGPGLRDKLSEKFEHLVTHQTQLSRKHPELMPEKIDESWCLLKGRMFYQDLNAPTPAFFADNHPRGQWQMEDQWQASTPAKKYLSLNKADWLSEIKSLDKQSQEKLTPELTTGHFPQCYAQIEDGKETSRLFLLPQNFWERAKATDLEKPSS